MADNFVGEIRIVSFNFAPKGWALCNGQVLPINLNTALFALLGTTYGGNGTSTFALPNMKGNVPVHFGVGVVDGNSYQMGQVGGEPTHTLINSEMPAHTHVPAGSPNNANLTSPANSVWATVSGGPYAASSNVAMNPACVAVAGGSQPHPNMAPYLVLNFIIALQGIFPTRN